MSKDEIFKENMTTIADFTFGEKVASVFDDMLDRSVLSGNSKNDR